MIYLFISFADGDFIWRLIEIVCSAPLNILINIFLSLFGFARVSSHVHNFNTRNKVLTAKLLKQGYRYHKFRKAFSKFYRRHFDLVSEYNVPIENTSSARPFGT